MRKPPQPLCPRSSGGGQAGRLGAERRGDPGAALLGFQHREDTHFAGEQKTQRIHGVPHPTGVGHDRDAFPLRQVVDRDIEIVPSGAGKT